MKLVFNLISPRKMNQSVLQCNKIPHDIIFTDALWVWYLKHDSLSIGFCVTWMKITTTKNITYISIKWRGLCYVYSTQKLQKLGTFITRLFITSHCVQCVDCKARVWTKLEIRGRYTSRWLHAWIAIWINYYKLPSDIKRTRQPP